MDTEDLAIYFCPGCDPQDVFEHRPDGKVWDIRWHDDCRPKLDGPDDSTIIVNTYLSGSGESEGFTNRLVQALIR